MISRKFLIAVGIIVALLLAGGVAAYYFRPADTSDKSVSKNSSSENDSDGQGEEKPGDDGSESPVAVTKQLQIYHVAMDDGGKSGDEIGCGDSLVPVKTEPVTTSDPTKEAMTRLLSADQYYGESGLYNALYQSDLTYEKGRVDGDTVTVELSGTLRQGGVCDAPRVEAQLERTAMNAAGVSKVNITVNGKALSEVLSPR